MRVFTYLLITVILTACGGGDDSSTEPLPPAEPIVPLEPLVPAEPIIPVEPPVVENKLPIIEVNSELNVDEMSLTVMSAAATDEDGTVVSYLWQQKSGTSVTLENPDTETLSFISPEVSEDEQLNFTITVTDNDGGISEEQVTTFVNNVNKLPIIEVSSEVNVDELSIVEISAEATDEDGTVVGYLWQQESGTLVSLEDVDTHTLLFTAPEVSEDEQLSFSITVTDNEGGVSEELITVFINKVEPNLINLNVSISNESVDDLVETQSIFSEQKDTTFKTFAQVENSSLTLKTELTQQSSGEWTGVIKDVPENTEMTFMSTSIDFAGNELYQYTDEKSFDDSEAQLNVEQMEVEETVITVEPIDLCKVYTDKDGTLFELEFQESTREDGSIVQHVGYRKGGEFIWHNHCGPAYTEYYASGLKFRDSYYLENIEYNNGDISYISYNDNIGFDGVQAKSEIIRNDKNGEYFLFQDEPSRINYYESGHVFYKTWYEGASFGREFGPDQIHYADVEGNHYTNMWWYNLEQMKTKRKDFDLDGKAVNCIYFDRQGNYEEVDSECLNEAEFDMEYNINGNIEPVDVCNNYIDSNGSVYPITTEESNGYLTTGYTKDNQYIYHNECSAAMTRFFESGNTENSWTFRNGVNTNPNGFSSTSYYDAVDAQGRSIKRMDSKIENGFYIIEDDKPSVIKYFMNGDVQYRSWMKTTAQGDWVYGRDKGPDIVNYSYGNNGYQKKDVYWFDEESHMLKRKYYDDEGSIEFCSYYREDDRFVDSMCENEQSLDEEYLIN